MNNKENLVAEISLKLYECGNVARLDVVEQGTIESYSLLASVIKENINQIEVKKTMALLKTILTIYKSL